MNILFSISIAGVALFVAKIVIFIVGAYFLSFIIWGAMKRKSEPNIKDLFKSDTIIFAVFFIGIFAIVALYMFLLYGKK